MPNQYTPRGKGRGGSNKQGTAPNQSMPLRAWKGIAERLERDYPPYERPEAITRPLTKTGKPRKRMNTQQREQRNDTRRRNKAERAAKSEHERRSKAAKKGWDKISARERTERALKGWDTRDRKRGMRPGHRENQRLMESQTARENRRRRAPSNPWSPLPRGDDPNHPGLGR